MADFSSFSIFSLAFTVAMTFLTVLLCALLAVALWTTYGLIVNYRKARGIGLPIVFSPVDTFSPLWAITRPFASPVLKRLPFKIGEFARYSYVGWPWEHKYAMHARLGDAFVVVTPASCEVIIADASAGSDVLKRSKDFPKRKEVYAMFDIFGPSINSVEGEDWQRQRRVTTPPFNERNNTLVWTESLAQARAMLAVWFARDGKGTGTIKDDTSSLTLNVLSGAGFGILQEFDSQFKQIAPGHSLSYLDAIGTLMDNMMMAVVMSSEKIPLSILPRKIAKVGHALAEFKKYMTEMVETERLAYTRGETGSANLMSTLVRVSEQARGEVDKTSKRVPWLSDAEIYGNLFIYNVAGHETTANALAFAIPLLAANPQWQAWIGEEIQHVLGKAGPGEEASYAEAFPQLKRCMAVMYETLRLYTPLSGIPRWTGKSYQQVRIGERMHTLPPQTAVFVNNSGGQMNPRYWGEDCLTWRPSRWISDTPTKDGVPNFAEEELLPPPIEGSFMPWAYGPRICPGKKFAQVEFVAVISQLFQHHRAEPVLELAGENMYEARRRMQSTVEDSHMVMTVTMKYPERIKLKWLPK